MPLNWFHVSPTRMTILLCEVLPETVVSDLKWFVFNKLGIRGRSHPSFRYMFGITSLINLTEHCTFRQIPGAPFLNTLRANFFIRNKNIILHLMSFVHIGVTQWVEIFPGVRQEHSYSTQSIPWVLMSRRRKSQGISKYDINYVEPNWFGPAR